MDRESYDAFKRVGELLNEALRILNSNLVCGSRCIYTRMTLTEIGKVLEIINKPEYAEFEE